ncbi:MAG: DUF4032 domain-containing protein [Anaerolineales bacterium]|nr:DUF4032 domain-containing protein [Anaerolineales bacterium]
MAMESPSRRLHILPGYPDFSDLPWETPLAEWQAKGVPIQDMPRGLSRHPVLFIKLEAATYAIKEYSPQHAAQEHEALLAMHTRRLPAVQPVGYVQARSAASALITRYLHNSLPYRTLLMSNRLASYSQHLLDAIAALLVQLHLAGVYWGDCSLSNTLFRRDAGKLTAYLVDAETSEAHAGPLPPTLRHHDLEIMEANIDAEISDLISHHKLMPGIPHEAGAYIRIKYQRLWEEITRDVVIKPGENYLIQEQIRALNALGFAVNEVKLVDSGGGNQLRFHIHVSARNFHRNLLQRLTGLEAEEMQAQKMINEISELKATLSQERSQDVPLEEVARHWYEHIYTPTVEQMQPHLAPSADLAETYCQILENKWYLSEKSRCDVGHHTATLDFIANHLQDA